MHKLSVLKKQFIIYLHLFDLM